MQPVESLKFAGILAVVCTGLALTFMLRHYRGDYGMTISGHAAAHRHAYVIFASTLTLFGIVFYTFLWKWFAPTLGLPRLFVWLLVPAAICQFLAAWVPEKAGKQARIHAASAFVLFALIIPLTVTLLFAPHLHIVIKIAVLLYLGMAAVFTYLFFFVKSARRHYLIYESTYLGAFLLLILSVAYIR